MMIVKVLYTPLLLLLLAASSDQRNADLFVESLNQNSVSLTWSVDNEAGISKYWIERKMENDMAFMKLSGDGNRCKDVVQGGRYECMDSNLYKSTAEQETIIYQLWAQLENGDEELLNEKSVGYTTNAVRRTWGNIKSMFQ